MKVTLKKALSVSIIALFLVSLYSMVGLTSMAESTAIKIEAESGSFSPADKKESGTSSEGNSWISGYNNMTASYTLADDFAEGEYELSIFYVTPCNDGGIVVTVGDSSATTAFSPSNSTGAWDWQTAATQKLGKYDLKAGDVISLHTAGTSPYIQIDYLTLTLVTSKTTAIIASATTAANTSPSTGDVIPVVAFFTLTLAGATVCAICKRKMASR